MLEYHYHVKDSISFQTKRERRFFVHQYLFIVKKNEGVIEKYIEIMLNPSITNE